jgi:hypothetical protein
MGTRMVATLSALALAACSGPADQAEGTYNDVATGARLLGADIGPSAGASPVERATRLAECSAALTSHVGQTPPPERADQLRALAERLQRAAVTLGEANGRTAADVNRLRDEAIAGHRQLAANNASAYNAAMAQAVQKCSLAEVMTDDELAGRGLAAPPAVSMDSMNAPSNELGPPPAN